MALNSLTDVYKDMLQDLYSACSQSLEVTAELGRAAHDDALQKALKDGDNGIARGMDDLASLCADHGIDPKGEHCKGMEGLAAEARAHALDEDYGDKDARDAMIAAQYQRMVHYALAGYGTVVAFANRLGLDGDAAVLEKNLDHCYDGDRRVTEVVTKGGVNKRAA